MMGNNEQKIYFSNIEEKRSKKQTHKQKYEKKAQLRKLGESNEKKKNRGIHKINKQKRKKDTEWDI